MDDKILWRIGATQFMYRRQSSVSRRIVALLTSRHSGQKWGRMVCCEPDAVTAPLKHSNFGLAF